MSISIDSVSALYNTNNVSTNTNKLEETLKSSDFSQATNDELMEVCEEFESYFTEQMFKAMQKMVPENEDEDTSSYTKQTKDYYTDMMIQSMAEASTEQGGLGIAQTLYEQMKHNYGLE